MCTSEVAAKLKVKTLKWENHSDHDLNSHFTHSEIFIKNVRYSQETKNSKNIGLIVHASQSLNKFQVTFALTSTTIRILLGYKIPFNSDIIPISNTIKTNNCT